MILMLDSGVSLFLRCVMIDAEVATGRVWQVRQDVVLGNFDDAVLHIFGMHELHFAQHARFFQQDRANKAIKVTTCEETKFPVLIHVLLPNVFDCLNSRLPTRTAPRAITKT